LGLTLLENSFEMVCCPSFHTIGIKKRVKNQDMPLPKARQTLKVAVVQWGELLLGVTNLLRVREEVVPA